MKYESPTQLRERQRRADEMRKQRRRRPVAVRVMTDEEWSAKCDLHISAIANPISASNAGAHARALVHMAIQRRAAEIQREYRRQNWKAMQMARHELLNAEVQ